jgi:uncharacterized membrane protein YfcA
MGTIALAIGLGFLAGILAGLFGVGGGILFVPTLTLGLGLTRQHRYANVDWRTALMLGVCAVAGVEGGVLIAQSLPEDMLRRLFGALTLCVAAQVGWRARARRRI